MRRRREINSLPIHAADFQARIHHRNERIICEILDGNNAALWKFLLYVCVCRGARCIIRRDARVVYRYSQEEEIV